VTTLFHNNPLAPPRFGRVSRPWAAFGLAAPAYTWLLVTVFLPLSAMLYFSFLAQNPLSGYDAKLTLQQYHLFFERDFYRYLTGRSLLLGLYVSLGCLIVGYPTALMLARHVNARWRETLLLIIVLPFWSNALVRIFSWTMVLRNGGFLDDALRLAFPTMGSLGMLYSYPAIVIGLIHSFVPYMILTSYLSLQAIDESLLEAARSLGANHWTTFYRITLPLSMPGMIVGLILIFVPVTGSFMEARVLGGRSGIMLGTVIEDQFTEVFNWPLGAALSFTMLGIVLIILLFFQLALRCFVARV
jgi:spermidine/putrescine transport system permease protein